VPPARRKERREGRKDPSPLFCLYFVARSVKENVIPLTGQMLAQRWQTIHSPVLVIVSFAPMLSMGHAAKQFPQWVQVCTRRRHKGRMEANDNKAPEGHRNRHQNLGTLYSKAIRRRKKKKTKKAVS